MKLQICAVFCFTILTAATNSTCENKGEPLEEHGEVSPEVPQCLLQMGRKLHSSAEVHDKKHATLISDQDDPTVLHVSVMNDPSFWWMLTAVVFLMAAFVVRSEVAANIEEPKNQVIQSAPEDRGTDELSDEIDYSRATLLKLAFCFVFLNVTMILWGIAQEYVMTNVYPSEGGGASMPSSLFLVLCNRVFTVLFSVLILKIRGKPCWQDGSHGCFPFALSNTISSWCQYSSLQYLSFSLQTAAKNSKLLPVMILGSLRGYQYKVVDYAECLVLVICCFIFGKETEQDTSTSGSTTMWGVLLLAVYVSSDAGTPHLQDRFFKSHPQFDALQATLAMAIWASAGMLIVLAVNGGLIASVEFLAAYPVALLHVLVLSFSSALTQYMVSYTIKNFGPMIFTLMATIRQFISVLVSAVLFGHRLTPLTLESMMIMTGTVLVRAFRPLFQKQREQLHEDTDFQSRWDQFVASQTLIVCVGGIVIFYLVYGLMQEFLAYHTFSGSIFNFPVFLVAVNHTTAAFFSLVLLKVQGMEIPIKQLYLTGLPASTNLCSTVFQHAALYYVYFPVQTIMKTLKILPVMAVGSIMRTRVYSTLDYFEALLITGLVGYFVWDLTQGEVSTVKEVSSVTVMTGILLMLGYVVVDCFTCNLEDYVYQKTSLDPAHMLLGMESISAAIAWVILMLDGELFEVVAFVRERPDVLNYVFMLAACAALGSYTCTITVRLFGPAVFTLIMTCRQILSMALSVVMFKHEMDSMGCLAAATVAALVLMSSWRRVNAQAKHKNTEMAFEDVKQGLHKS